MSDKVARPEGLRWLRWLGARSGKKPEPARDAAPAERKPAVRESSETSKTPAKDAAGSPPNAGSLPTVVTPASSSPGATSTVATRPAPAKKPPNKPVIGILVEDAPLLGHPLSKGAYARAVESSGGAVRWLHDDGRPAAELLDGVHGVLIPGGKDVHPELYGETPNSSAGLQLGSLSFDRFEIALVQQALQQKLPIRGICRGHQLLNVAAGGKLLQDIPMALGQPYPSLRHRSGGHLIKVLKESRLGKAMGETVDVNSYHHQAISVVAPGFLPVAVAADAVIEGIEKMDDSTVLGVQFHPERATDSVKKAFFDCFVEDASSVWKKLETRPAPLAITPETAQEQLQAGLEELRKSCARSASVESRYRESDFESMLRNADMVPPADETSARIRQDLVNLLACVECQSFYKRDILTALGKASRYTEPQAQIVTKLMEGMSGSNQWTVAEAVAKAVAVPDLTPLQAELLKLVAQQINDKGGSSLSGALVAVLKYPDLGGAQFRLLQRLTPMLDQGGGYAADIFTAVMQQPHLKEGHLQVLDSFATRLQSDGYNTSRAMQAVLRHPDVEPEQVSLLKALTPSLNAPFAADTVDILLKSRPRTDIQRAMIDALLRRFSNNSIYKKDVMATVLARHNITAIQADVVGHFIPLLYADNAYYACEAIKETLGYAEMDEGQAQAVIALKEMVRGNNAYHLKDALARVLRPSSAGKTP